MDSNGCRRPRRMHDPEFNLRRSFSSAVDDGKRDRTERKEKQNKNVTIATTSRYLTEQSYVTRKPLFSKEKCTSLLKVETQKGEPLAVSGTEHYNMKPLTQPRERQSHVLLPSASIDDPCSLLTLPRLQSRLQARLQARLRRDEPGSGSPFHGSSSILEVQRVNPPFRPPLTSTVLYPTYTPRTHQTQPSMQEESSGGQTRLGHPKELSSGSSYQADYWACAIPKALPPSPNRHSASWNPNKEYEALLDYTYPLRPGHVDTKWDGSELNRDSFLKTDSNMQDSGIELDPRCSSASLAGLDFSDKRTEKIRDGGGLCTGYRSADLQGFPRSSDGPPSNTSLSLTHPSGLFLDSSGDGDETSYHSRDGYSHQPHAEPSVSISSVHSTSVLPRFTCEFGEVDEDFLLLPVQLEEMQRLSRQVREVTARLRPPLTASSDSPDQDAILSSVSLPRRRQAKEEEDVKQQNEHERAVDGRDSETFRSSFVLGVEPEGGQGRSGVRMEVEALVKELCDPALSEGQKNSQKLQEQSDSLMQQIQMFCSHLQQLIQQLYALSERMERLAAPSVDVDGVKSSLAEYQIFQRELIDHQPLTSCVLRAGQHLLNCINTTSPFLRDALVLIERQCGALQTHSDLLYSSILSAMDRLLQPPRSHQIPAGIHTSSLSTH